MTDGVLGPDEHTLAVDALDLFHLEPAKRCFERPHGDGYAGIVFPAREPAGELRGMVVLVADARHLSGSGQEKALKPELRSLLRRLAIHLRSRAAAAAAGESATTAAPAISSSDAD